MKTKQKVKSHFNTEFFGADIQPFYEEKKLNDDL